MTTETIPEDIRKRATQCFADVDYVTTVPEAIEIIAQFLMQERSRHRLRYARSSGLTIEEMRANIPAELRNTGDAILVWVNEGDFWLLPLEVMPAAIRSQPDTQEGT